MTAMEPVVKTCTKCGETKPLSQFHRNRRSPDGHQTYCKPCMNEGVRQRQQRRRNEIGEEAYLAIQRDIQRRHRERTGNRKGRQYEQAKYRAFRALADRHEVEFEHLFLLARRGEL